MTNPTTVPCKWCDTPTTMTGTQCCDFCWELYRRIFRTPQLAQRMLTAARLDRLGLSAAELEFAQSLNQYGGLELHRDDPAFQQAQTLAARGHAVIGSGRGPGGRFHRVTLTPTLEELFDAQACQ